MKRKRKADKETFFEMCTLTSPRVHILGITIKCVIELEQLEHMYFFSLCMSTVAVNEHQFLTSLRLFCVPPFSSLALDTEAPADPVAPVIVIPPRNTTVVAGVSEATLECVANAR